MTPLTQANAEGNGSPSTGDLATTGLGALLLNLFNVFVLGK